MKIIYKEHCFSRGKLREPGDTTDVENAADYADVADPVAEAPKKEMPKAEPKTEAKAEPKTEAKAEPVKETPKKTAKKGTKK